MALGFPAYHTESYVPRGASHDVRFAVKRALSALGWELRDEGPTWVRASVSMNWRSNGETMFVEFMSDGSLTVTSKCTPIWWLFMVQCFDWGKNESNVRRFLGELKKLA